MEYPTLQEKLIMPEYGRNIQRMVAYAKTLPTREERTRCTNSIIHIMGNLFPYLRDVNDFRHKLWDHVAIMADFDLDIDFPYDRPQEDILHTKPEPIPYCNSRIRHMHYGRMVQDMIAKVPEYEGEERKQLLLAIANQMKKNYLLWNKNTVDDRKILDDLRELSDGKIDLQTEDLKLVQTHDVLSKKNIKPNANNNGHQAQNRNNKKR